MDRPGNEAIIPFSHPECPKGIIAGKELIAAVPGQRHRHMLSRLLAEQIGGHQRAVPHRLIELADDLRQKHPGSLYGEDFLVMLRVIALGDDPGIFCFVEACLFKTDAEAFHARLPGRFRRKGRDGG